MYIDSSDFRLNGGDDKDFFGLAPGKTVRLLNGYDLTCAHTICRQISVVHGLKRQLASTRCVSVAADGSLVCEYDPASLTTKPGKTQGKIGWLGSDAAVVCPACPPTCPPPLRRNFYHSSLGVLAVQPGR